MVGLNYQAHDLGKALGKDFEVMGYDPQVDPEFCLQFDPENPYGSYGYGFCKERFRDAQLYYLSGNSVFVSNWPEIKDYVRIVGENLKTGDWVIFSDGIDADMAEIVLLPLMESISGLKMGSDFYVAFDPKMILANPPRQVGNALKFSHNLIVHQVARILGIEAHPYKNFELSFFDQDRHYAQLKETIRRSWLPVLNSMDHDLFQEFYQSCLEQGFLDAYEGLRLPNEHRTDPLRFFRIAQELGFKHSYYFKQSLGEWPLAS